jgi:hypothetical protein
MNVQPICYKFTFGIYLIQFFDTNIPIPYFICGPVMQYDRCDVFQNPPSTEF